MRYTGRNRRPAYGPDILSLTQLRYYLRLFWSDRRYGICHIPGGKAAFLRWCGEEYTQQVRSKLLLEEPNSEYLSSRLQRLLSRKVLQVLRGEVIFVPDGHGSAIWRPLLLNPEPPMPLEPLCRDYQFRLEKTPFGPKIRRF